MTATLVYGGLTLTASPYTVLLAGVDLGNAKPVVSSVRSLFLDGSVVTGRFSDNRTVGFQVLIQASTAALTTAALDNLAYQVDQQVNAITFTPGGTALPQVWDTFRGELHEDFAWEGKTDTQRLVTVTMPALPFGRTPGTSVLAAPGTTSVSLQDFESATEPNYTASGYSSTAMTRVTSPVFAGTYSGQATYQINNTSPVGTAVFFQVLATVSSTSLTGRTLARMMYFNDGKLTDVYGTTTAQDAVIWNTAKLTLSSSGGSSTWTVVPPTTGPLSAWVEILFDLTASPSSTTGSGYTASAVTGWTFRLDGANNYSTSGIPMLTTNLYLDDLRAFPPGYGTATSADAGTYVFAPVAGSARCPVDLRVDRGGTSTVKDLIVYQAPPEAATGYAPLLIGSSPYSTPTGVEYAGTFTVVASIKAASQSTSQSVAVSIQQQQGGTNVGSAWTSGTIATVAGDAYVMLGETTLPLVGTSQSNTGVSFVVTVTTGSSVVLDVFLLDTRGAFVMVGPAPLSTAVDYLFVAAPLPATGVGGVFSGSASDLTDATSVLASSRMSGGQLQFEPGSNSLTVCSTQASGDLVITASYAPRWLTERTS